MSTPAQTPSEQHSTSKYVLFAVVTVVFTVLDQWSKIWIQNNVALYREELPVIPGFFSIVHAENTGAAFGILNDSPYRMWVFAAFTVVALGVLLQMLWQLPKDDKLQNIALGLIMSGAVGNAIDRVLKQSVTDFLKIYTDNEAASAWLIERFGTSQWPSFNVADAAIVVGLIFFLIHALFFETDDENAEAAPPTVSVDVDAEAEETDDVPTEKAAEPGPAVAAEDEADDDAPTEVADAKA